LTGIEVANDAAAAQGERCVLKDAAAYNESENLTSRVSRSCPVGCVSGA